MKKYLKYFSLLLVGVLLTGCAFLEDEKTYEVNGIKITMANDMVEKDLVSQTAYLEGDEVIFTALKESFTDLSQVGITEESALKDYANLILTGNKLDSKVIEDDTNNVTYFTYEKEISGKDFYYLASVYKANDAFWLVNFACEKKNADEYKDKFLKWASTVEFYENTK